LFVCFLCFFFVIQSFFLLYFDIVFIIHVNFLNMVLGSASNQVDKVSL
jgi:hypothetical protein